MSDTDIDTARREAGHERAHIYLAVYRELEARLGASEAVDILRAALHEHGRTFGKTLAKHAPADFEGLIESFAKSPDGGTLFSPVVERCDDAGLDVQFMSCPLKQAWQDAGLDDAMLRRMLHCASAIDEGTMDEAGFDLTITPWQPGKAGCCHVSIRRRDRPDTP